ncbi:MAG: hypothetical protein EPO13_11065 [Actinomycetota bacterium]|nr:MAG: hypothetical protein EPO13_11065 [Actinomycetota bacterium]
MGPEHRSVTDLFADEVEGVDPTDPVSWSLRTKEARMETSGERAADQDALPAAEPQPDAVPLVIDATTNPDDLPIHVNDQPPVHFNSDVGGIRVTP